MMINLREDKCWLALFKKSMCCSVGYYEWYFLIVCALLGICVGENETKPQIMLICKQAGSALYIL